MTIHNLIGYDLHMIIKEVIKISEDPGDVNCIPLNEQKYISFSKKVKGGETERLVRKWVKKKGWVEEENFLNMGLSALVENMDPNNLIITRDFFEDSTDLFLKKGVFPYTYLDSIKKLEETSLPPKKDFEEKLDEGVVYRLP